MAGHFKDFHLLLLHSTGKRTGRRYVTPLLYIQDGDRYIVVGSNAGADNEPAWVANVAAMAEVGIEVGGQTLNRQADDPTRGRGTEPPPRRDGGLLSRCPRIPDPHHAQVSTDSLGPG
jgi:deazaflavin-dependent oxidoreductase (nitroreductase family)